MTQIQPKPLGPDAVGLELPEMSFEYTDRDVILYALGVGATELDFVYERSLKTLPSYAVIPAFPAMTGLSAAVEINLVMVLHGEQAFHVHKTIPTRGRLTTTGRVAGVYDKGKGALATVEMQTLPIQAMIYRLSGDRNPLHIDPDFAKMAGYDRPILHGLCTFGHVGRAVLQEYCGNDPSRFGGLSVRFSGVVYPGDTIITEMWDEGNGKVVLQAKTQEGRVVISNAAAEVK